MTVEVVTVVSHAKKNHQICCYIRVVFVIYVNVLYKRGVIFGLVFNSFLSRSKNYYFLVIAPQAESVAESTSVATHRAAVDAASSDVPTSGIARL